MAKKSTFPTENEVRTKAYQIYLERGCRHGYAIDDWEQAEYELAQLPVAQLAKLAAPKFKRSNLAVANVIQAALFISAGGLMTLRG